MPSDLHLLTENRLYVDTDSREELVRLVRLHYPTACAEGACGSFSFCVGSELVAEAWMHPTKRGWWLRVKSKDGNRGMSTSGQKENER